MILANYLIHVRTATTAKTLRALKLEAQFDSEINDTEREQVNSAIAEQFGNLNFAEAGQSQPRWK